jgi:hypothetical protein
VYAFDATAITNRLVDLVTNLSWTTTLTRTAVTPDARFLVRQSLNGGTNTVWRDDLDAGTTQILFPGVAIPGVATNYTTAFIPNWRLAVTPDGRWVTFVHRVSVDTNQPPNAGDNVYAVDSLNPQSPVLVSADESGQPTTDGPSDNPWITADGRFIAFRSASNQLTPGHPHAHPEVFIRDLETGTLWPAVTTDPSPPVNDNWATGLWMASATPVVAFTGRVTDQAPGDVTGLPGAYVSVLSVPPIVQLTFAWSATGHPLLKWTTPINYRCTVQFKESLNDPLWHNSPITPTDDAGNWAMEDTSNDLGTQRFYRVVLSP